MAQYIDKDAVVAEIKERINKNNERAASYSSDSEHDYFYRVKEDVYKDLLYFLKHLEVKEVDLDKEVERFVKSEEFQKASGTIKVTNLLAKHFFELGLKAQKGDK